MFLERRVTGMNTVRCVTLTLMMHNNTRKVKEDQKEIRLDRAVHRDVFFSKTNEMHQFLKFILFCSSTLHVSVFPSIIRSLRLLV
jgi:hypothetical protein